LTKSQRQHRIVQILEHHVVSTGAQLVNILNREGFPATQATVTRDIQELGVVKTRDSDGVRRLILTADASPGPAPLEHLRRMMGEWAVGVESSGQLVVVRTPPGCAHVVASALDRSTVPGIIGTVAGDDTILVIAAEETSGESVAHHLRQLAGLVAQNAPLTRKRRN
jgi:transcriptional regulator of arginine metabolism